MKLDGNTKVLELINEHPFLEDFLIQYSSKFQMLKNKALRATMGKMATLKMASAMTEVPLEKLINDLANEIEKHTGTKVEIDEKGAGGLDAEKILKLKQIIADLKSEKDFDEVKKSFDELIVDIDADEIVQMEQQLIRDGLPATEIQRLCDVHVGVFKDALDKKEELDIPIGHPLHTYKLENDAISEVANQVDSLVQKLVKEPSSETFNKLKDNFASSIGQLSEIDKHYQRKEHQLFPYLEKRGITAPPQVMWGLHDEIRGHLKEIRMAVDAADFEQIVQSGPALTRDIIEMVYKENNILFAMAMTNLSLDDWIQIKRSETEIGYALVDNVPEWSALIEQPEKDIFHEFDLTGKLKLETGILDLKQLNLLLTSLPLDISFVDENDEVAYFSAGKERVFHRGPEIIGRKVQFCHPPKSLDIVTKILDAFKDGSKDTAEFWIELNKKFIYIRYIAIRNSQNEYKGCLEVTQDVTTIRNLDGERRLLSWDEENG